MERNKSTRVVFQPYTHQAMLAGINQIVNAVRPTLGPLPRKVAISKVKPHDQLPEILDSGGIIARRIIQLPDRDADIGAMFIRQLLWRQHERVGDGAATTAVLFQSVYQEALKFIVSGGNSMVMRSYLEEGMRMILSYLESMTIPVKNKEMIVHVAESVCYDPELAKSIGEIFDVIGMYGQIDLRSGNTRQIKREYVGGIVFDGGFFTAFMINDSENIRAYLEKPAIFLSDLEIKEPEEIIPIIRVALDAGYQGLVIVAKTISEKVMGILQSVSKDPERFRAFAVKIPGISVSQQTAYLEDLSILTGGSLFLKIASNQPQKIQKEDLGSARRVWADRNFFGIFSGGGDPITLRRHVNLLKQRYRHIDDDEIKNLTLSRLGKLMGGSATIYIGGSSEPEIDHRKEIAGWAIDTVRSALSDGVLPGGGAALFTCKSILDASAIAAISLEEKVSYRILSRAMEEPIRTILSNAGHDPDLILAQISNSASVDGFDVRSGKTVDMVDSGIYDSAGVLLEAVRGAISSAALALTVDTFVHPKRPEIADKP